MSGKIMLGERYGDSWDPGSESFDLPHRQPGVLVPGLHPHGLGVVSEVTPFARSCGGRLLRPGVAWVRPCRRPGWYWLDGDALTARAATLTDGSDKHVLLLAALLVDGDAPTPHQRRHPRRAAA